MNAEEPIQTIGQNQILGSQGEDLPEQSQVATTTMPRPMSVSSLIYQWQPMGIRVIVNLPFIGNDSDCIFYIRNGPLVPYPADCCFYSDSAYDSNAELYKDPVSSFGTNNMQAVAQYGDKFEVYPNFSDTSKAFPVVITQYDMPPPIASFAHMFRRWRGDMQYRIRVVAGSITQGYIIIMPYKNVFIPIAVYDQFKVRPALQKQDASYRPQMINSYGLVDVAMFRHSEITVPFDYPVPYYDQYAWMARRVTPAPFFLPYSGTGQPPTKAVGRDHVASEPHGDNLIGVGLRGALQTSLTGSQLEFEIEYRCAEGFQFADPFLPHCNIIQSSVTAAEEHILPYRIPDRAWTSDGIGRPKKTALNKAQVPAPKDGTPSRPMASRLGSSSRHG